MAMQFSFEYCIDPKDHKSEEEYKAIAVEGAKIDRFKSTIIKNRSILYRNRDR